MKITERRLRYIIRKIVKENNNTYTLSDKEEKVVGAVISAIQHAQNETVSESALKDIANIAVDIGFRMFSFKATIPMIASGIILYAQHKGIQPDQLTVESAQSIVNFIGLEGNNALQVVINIIAGLGGAYGVVKGRNI